MLISLKNQQNVDFTLRRKLKLMLTSRQKQLKCWFHINTWLQRCWFHLHVRSLQTFPWLLLPKISFLSKLIHWCLNEIAHNPPLIPLCFLEYFRVSKRTKINHMHSNHRHKIRFQDLVYLKLNKWRAKRLKNINKTTLAWCINW